jgi:hypothetical protein
MGHFSAVFAQVVNLPLQGRVIAKLVQNETRFTQLLHQEHDLVWKQLKHGNSIMVE